ncbi:MAG: hypothetical protein U0822_08370 [Anaerolineae bacterium]
MKRHASVQTAHIGLDAIEDGIVRLKDSQYRAVLEVSSVNFGLTGEVEQEAIIAGYAAMLNSLTFPVQMVVRVLPVDLDGYLTDMERQAQEGLSEALAALARDHATFLRRLARHRTLLERRFYLVVPAQLETDGKRPTWPFKRVAIQSDEGTMRRQLTFRCDELARQLGRCGLTARRLGDVELAQLYHASWCPDLARTQRLQRHLADYTALVIQNGQGERRAS